MPPKNAKAAKPAGGQSSRKKQKTGSQQDDNGIVTAINSAQERDYDSLVKFKKSAVWNIELVQRRDNQQHYIVKSTSMIPIPIDGWTPEHKKRKNEVYLSQFLIQHGHQNIVEFDDPSYTEAIGSRSFLEEQQNDPADMPKHLGYQWATVVSKLCEYDSLEHLRRRIRSHAREENAANPLARRSLPETVPEAFIWHVLWSVTNALIHLHWGHQEIDQVTNPGKLPKGQWHSIVHGDIHLENMFLERGEAGKYPNIRLGDFDCATQNDVDWDTLRQMSTTDAGRPQHQDWLRRCHTDIHQLFKEVVRLCGGSWIGASPERPDGRDLNLDDQQYSEELRGLLWSVNGTNGMIDNVHILACAVKHFWSKVTPARRKYKALPDAALYDMTRVPHDLVHVRGPRVGGTYGLDHAVNDRRVIDDVFERPSRKTLRPRPAWMENLKRVSPDDPRLAPGDICPICRAEWTDSNAMAESSPGSSFGHPNPFVKSADGEVMGVVSVPCTGEHVFHQWCLETWCHTAVTCPMCNHKLGEKPTGPDNDSDVEEDLDDFQEPGI